MRLSILIDVLRCCCRDLRALQAGVVDVLAARLRAVAVACTHFVCIYDCMWWVWSLSSGPLDYTQVHAGQGNSSCTGYSTLAMLSWRYIQRIIMRHLHCVRSVTDCITTLTFVRWSPRSRWNVHCWSMTDLLPSLSWHLNTEPIGQKSSQYL